MAQLQLRPFTVGEMLDAAFKIYRDRFRTLVTITAVVVVPLGIIQAVLAAQIIGTEPEDIESGEILGALVASAVVLLLAAVVTQVATAALTLGVADAYLGDEKPWGQYLSSAFARTGAIIGASLLFAIAVFVGFFGLIVGAIIIGTGLGVFMPALMVERLGVTESLGRAWRLSSGHRLRVFGTWLVASILVQIVSWIVVSIVGVGVTSTAVIAQQLLAVVASLVTTPFMAAIVVVIYFDLRVRKEGFDIQMLASQVGGSPAPAASDDFPPPEATEGGGDSWPPPAD